jgi:hypothetical protein
VARLGCSYCEKEIQQEITSHAPSAPAACCVWRYEDG